MIQTLALFLAMLYPLWEATNVRVVRRDLELERLPEALDGLTLCLLTDLHTERWGRRERNLLRQVRGLEADVVLLGGDQSRTLRGMEHSLRVARAIRSRHGIFAVCGNSEHKRRTPTRELLRRWQEAGVTVLRNGYFSLEVRGQLVHLIGVDDPSQDLDDLDRACRGLAQEGLRILLSHTPEGITGLGRHQVDLVLSGHTHGGQVRLPGIGALYTHSHRGIPFDMGLFTGEQLRRYNPAIEPHTRLYVSRGIGTAVMPVRFLAAPEVSLLRLLRPG